jgi:hypothetical protein
MQTINFHCGKCGNLMAVSMDDVGGQVHCPHCLEIIQVPEAVPPPAGETTDDPTRIEEVDSILADSSNGQDDLFSGPAPALVQMPSDKHGPLAATPEDPPAVNEAEKTTAFWEDSAPEKVETSAEISDQTSPSDTRLPSHEIPRLKTGRKWLVPMMLMFLIPYSLVCTAFIATQFLNPPRSQFDPLERLPDSNPADGGPKERIKFDAPLPEKLKTSLGKPLRVGAIEVTPLRVQMRNDDLVLHLKMINHSENLTFNPLPDSFVRFGARHRSGLKPYTYLQAGDNHEPIFGGFLQWIKCTAADRQPCDGVIGPGEELLVKLTTAGKEENRAIVRAILHSNVRMLWRVQVRRGFLPVHGKNVSATAVIGVRFSPRDIERGDDVAALP